MVTIKEIAKHCNVSIATVSNIINGKPNASKETKERVLQAIEELNYTPNYIAKNLKTRRTRTIGVVVEDITVFCAPEIIDGITKCCEEKGYHILLTNLRLYKKFGDSYYDSEKFFQMVRREVKELIAKQVDGIVYVTAHERALKCLPENLTVPASMAYGYTKSELYPSVVVDDKKGAYEIVNYVISMGHKKIGVITGKERSIHTHDRLLGYQKALYDHSLFFNPDAIVEGGWTREGGYAATDRLLEEKVTAIFCMNDIMAGGVYDRLEELGMIPGKDISVVGFDNRELSNYYKPPLTTTALPLYEIGYTACANVIEKVESEEDNKEEGTGQTPNTARKTKEPEKDDAVQIVEIPESCKLLIRQSVKDIRE